jgi:hypothetical protein
MAYNFEIVRGDTASFTLKIRRGRTVEDLTGADLFFTMKEEVSDVDASAVLVKDTDLEGGIVIGSPSTAGQAKLFFYPSDTSSLEPQEYVFDIQLKTTTGNIYTVATGTITIAADVTRRIT